MEREEEGGEGAEFTRARAHTYLCENAVSREIEKEAEKFTDDMKTEAI